MPDAPVRIAPLPNTERLSINALTAWVSGKNNLQERTVVECLKDEFGVKRVEDIPANRYEDAVRYLCDFVYS